MKKFYCLLSCFLFTISGQAENGYDLWLRYKKIETPALLSAYRNQLNAVIFGSASPTMGVIRKELSLGIKGMLNKSLYSREEIRSDGTILVGTDNSSPFFKSQFPERMQQVSPEGYCIMTKKINGKSCILILSHTEVGALYGVFHFLRLIQTQQPIQNLEIYSAPKIKLRMLDHWDNLNRYIERGYAGISLWNWQTLPGYIDPRYTDYARANASIGINGTVLTNVNANAIVLTPMYLEKVAALAKAFRPYGIKVYLTARFSAPIEIGGLKTADPLNDSVRNWWREKINEIYKLIPDFGGFLVKANSEGQPGPQNYGRNHADGANMLADALESHGGIVMWRAFVYSNENPEDRHKQAYNDFKPLDGKFLKNVLVQVKNGAIDFQPREPFHPLFGAMPKTPLMMEFQLTQEYLGFSTHLVYLAPMFKECLESETFANGKGSTVGKIIDGSLNNQALSGMAAVSNTGSDVNWCGHPFGQANWYALGRLAWDHDLSAAAIADEWIRMSFTNDPGFIEPVKRMMLGSREFVVKYMTPLGLAHLMGTGHHYGPAPWISNLSRPEWNPVYYHKSDSTGIGFNRTVTGSNALAQYAPELNMAWTDLHTCPEEFLLWFHHVPWNHPMRSGNTLWEELCFNYYSGTDGVLWMQKAWQSTKGMIDDERFEQVNMLLKIQLNEAVWWRNACLLYFQTFSRLPIPGKYEKPDHELDYYKALRFPYAPGNAQ